MGKLKIRPTKVQPYSDKVVQSKINRDEPVSFNFRRLRTEGEKFKYEDRDTSYFNKLIERLKNLCCMTRLDITIRNKGGLRCHKIDFSDTNVSEDGFGNVGEDVVEDAWQIQISSNEHGRIHGYFVGNVFYIVWLDPKHELWKRA